MASRDPAGIVTEAFPRNFKGRSEAGSISAFMVRRAAWATADRQGLLAKGVGYPDPQPFTPGTDMHDQTYRLVFRKQSSAVAGSCRLRGRRPGPNPMDARASKAVFDASTARTEASARKRFVIDRSP